MFVKFQLNEMQYLTEAVKRWSIIIYDEDTVFAV